MKPRTLTHLCITLIAMGLVVTAYAKKQDDGDKAPPKTKPMNVQVNDAAVRVSPSFLAEVATVLGYGSKVGVVEEGEDWMKIQTDEPAASGWIHATALTKKEINLEAGDTDTNVKASKEELTAGGRGYNQEIENKFREENQDLESGYKLLDRVTIDPTRQASRTEVMLFMRSGELNGKAGGGQ